MKGQCWRKVRVLVDREYKADFDVGRYYTYTKLLHKQRFYRNRDTTHTEKWNTQILHPLADAIHGHEQHTTHTVTTHTTEDNIHTTHYKHYANTTNKSIPHTFLTDYLHPDTTYTHNINIMRSNIESIDVIWTRVTSLIP